MSTNCSDRPLVHADALLKDEILTHLSVHNLVIKIIMSDLSDSFDVNEIAEVGEFKFGDDFNLEDSQEELF